MLPLIQWESGFGAVRVHKFRLTTKWLKLIQIHALFNDFLQVYIFKRIQDLHKCVCLGFFLCFPWSFSVLDSYQGPRAASMFSVQSAHSHRWRHQTLPDGALDARPDGAFESLWRSYVVPVQSCVGDLILGLRVRSRAIFGARHHPRQRALVILKLDHVELLLISQLLVGFLQRECMTEICSRFQKQWPLQTLFASVWLTLVTWPHLIGQPSEEGPGDIEKIGRSF